MSTIIKSSRRARPASSPLRFAEIAPAAMRWLRIGSRRADRWRKLAARPKRFARPSRLKARRLRSKPTQAHACQQRFDRHLAQMAMVVRQAVDELALAKAQWLAHWEKTAVHVAAAIAERLISAAKLRERPRSRCNWFARRWNWPPARPTCRFDCILRLRGAQARGRNHRRTSCAGKVRLSIVADPQVSRGGCRVERASARSTSNSSRNWLASNKSFRKATTREHSDVQHARRNPPPTTGRAPHGAARAASRARSA